MLVVEIIADGDMPFVTYLAFYLRAPNFSMECFCGLPDKSSQSIVLRGRLLNSLLNVKVYTIHELAFSQIDFFCDPSCPFANIHHIREGYNTCERKFKNTLNA